MNKKTQALKLGDAQVHPNFMFKKSQASKLGDAHGIPPFSSTTISLLHLDLYYSFIYYVLYLDCILLSFAYSWSYFCPLSFSSGSCFFSFRFPLQIKNNKNIFFSFASLFGSLFAFYLVFTFGFSLDFPCCFWKFLFFFTHWSFCFSKK